MMKYALTLLLAFLAPIQSLMIGITILIICDAVTGVAAARKVEEKITSKKLGTTLTKILVYNMLLVSAHVLNIIFLPGIEVVNICASIFAVYEFYSIGENFEKYTGIKFLKFIRSIIDKQLGRNIEDQNKKSQD